MLFNAAENSLAFLTSTTFKASFEVTNEEAKPSKSYSFKSATSIEDELIDEETWELEDGVSTLDEGVSDEVEEEPTFEVSKELLIEDLYSKLDSLELTSSEVVLEVIFTLDEVFEEEMVLIEQEDSKKVTTVNNSLFFILQIFNWKSNWGIRER